MLKKLVTTLVAWSVLAISLLPGQNFPEATDHESILVDLAVPPGEPGAITACCPTLSSVEALLVYHRRKENFDSILLITQAFAQSFSDGSQSSIWANFLRGEAHLNLYQNDGAVFELERLQAREGQVDPAASAFLDLCLLVLRGKYELEYGKNPEKAAILFLAAQKMTDAFPAFSPDIMLELSYSLGSLGQYEPVIEYLKEYRQTGALKNKDPLDEARYFLDLASLYIILEQWPQALAMTDKALAKLEPHGREMPAVLARAYFTAALASYRVDREKALFFLRRAISTKDHPKFKDLLVAALYHLGFYDEALEHIQQALTQSIVAYAPTSVLDNPTQEQVMAYGENIWNLLLWKSRVLYKKSIPLDQTTALPLLDISLEAADLGRRYNNTILFALDGYAMSQYEANIPNVYGLGYKMRAAYQKAKRTNSHEDLQVCFRTMEMRRNFLLSEAFSLDYLPAAVKAERTRRVRAIETMEYQFSQYGMEYFDQYGPALKRSVDSLDAFVQQIGRKYERPINDHLELEVANPDSIQASLDERTVYVQYASQWQHHYVYVITAQRQQVLKIYEGFDLVDKINDFINQLQSPLQVQEGKRDKFIKSSYGLYQVLLQPLEAHLAGKNKLIVVGDRDINLLPFEALLTNQESKAYDQLDYLLKTFEISYFPSGKFYLQQKRMQSVVNGAFLGFAPVFASAEAGGITQRSSAGIFRKKQTARRMEGFSPLPGTEREIREIGKMLEGETAPKLLLGALATGTALAQELSKPYQYVHIATHGLVNFHDPRLSAFATYDPSPKGGDYFYAHQIESLGIRADLAVLSACESGVGRMVEGENLIALSRSFIVAGTKNILYSLWQVDDQRSSNMMIDFYRHHRLGGSYATALRTAKLAMVKDPASALPRYWAPFVLMGE